MKVLVTGGAGFIGSHLTDRLIQKKHRVVVLDNLSTGRKKNVNKQAVFVRGDIRNLAFVSRVFRKEKPSGIFHLAALPRVPLSVADPIGTSEVNIAGTLCVFKAALDAKVKRIVFASSSSVYGDQKTLPLRENMMPHPVSPYGLQKWVGEQWAKMFSSLYGLPVISLRYFNVYGPRIDFDSDYSLVIGKFLRMRREGKPLSVFGDGTQTRAFCYVDDVVEATIKAMTAKTLKGGEIVNVGAADSHSVNELVNLLGGPKMYLPKRAGDVEHTRADLKLAKAYLAWEPKVSFAEGVERTKKWFLKHYAP
ncbi:MAG: NAD-dependent epimerase/dehydratase family protein [Parcubacteria group bacterium]|nr:NAD-dependent epimerase/dehydratase family protein [Parcubacteria group bacterium]